MAERLKRYEEVLRKAGIDSVLLDEESTRGQRAPAGEAVSDDGEKYSSPRGFRAPASGPFENQAPVSSEIKAKTGSGRLITKEGRSLYLDKFVISHRALDASNINLLCNSHLWKSVSNEVSEIEPPECNLYANYRIASR